MRILFVDDDRDAVEHFINDLDRGGHTVKKVDTITQARQELNAGSWPYELLILDVQMRPSHDELRSEEASLKAGLTFYLDFREQLKDVPVVILTNNLHRVPTRFVKEDPMLRAWDKVAMAGRLSIEIHRWIRGATKPTSS